MTIQIDSTKGDVKSDAELPTEYGNFRIRAFTGPDGSEHATLYTGDLAKSGDPPLVRIHSECLTGDAFGSLKCDCGPQLEASLRRIQDEGRGALVYLRQEGRGIGLYSKIQAYALQDQGHDTLDANLLLGLPADGRTYDVAAEMLRDLGLTKIRLMTNNPLKIQGLEENGIEVLKRLPHQSGVGPRNIEYLSTKRHRMGHLLNVE
ncbi:MAG: GTP cyclohydrolase II [Euryarchaeota archaeon]|mgnify:FL=1|nr:GTP cyclohydrolase II [Euryarchaeota archaeon]|tara:strand:+ start:12393 stop:13007 length:615 start_codon:yes stop_codon:yes gene_type:complete